METRVAWLLGAVLTSSSALLALEVGDPAPPVEVREWVRGKPVQLAKSKGKNILVVEFWATWCPPCRTSIPHLSQLQRRFAKDGVVIIGISNEDAAVVRAFVQKQREMDYRVAVDDGGRTHANWLKGIGGIPHAFIVNSKGTITWHGHPKRGLDKALNELVRTETRQANPHKGKRATSSRPESQEAGAKQRDLDEVFSRLLVKARNIVSALPTAADERETRLREAQRIVEAALICKPSDLGALALKATITACIKSLGRGGSPAAPKANPAQTAEACRSQLLGLLTNGRYVEAENLVDEMSRSADHARLKASVAELCRAAICHGFKSRSWPGGNEGVGGRRWVYTNCNSMKFALIPPLPGQGTRPFYMGVTEVTNRQYRRFSPRHDSGKTLGGADLNGDHQPVVRVSWQEATEFCSKLTQHQKKATYARNLPTPWAYRLPTSEEWEHACRAGTRATWLYSFGDDLAKLKYYAWYDENAPRASANVGLKLANGWGLHDMHGNVWEWCSTPYPGVPGARVIRGGSWGCAGIHCRAHFVNGEVITNHPLSKDEYKGFRVVRVFEPDGSAAIAGGE